MDSKHVLVFGIDQQASLAWYCLSHDTDHNVIGFVVNRAYLTKSTHEGLPVIPFEDIKEEYSPETTSVLIPTGYTRINGFRMERYLELKEKGYEPINYLSSKALAWPDLKLRGNCIIYENTVIQPFSYIGENVIVRSSVHISHHNIIGDHCFIAAGVILGGDVKIGVRSFLGLGCTIKVGVNIAERTFVGAGAVVVSDTEPNCVYLGNPAKKIEKTAMEITS